MADLPPAVLKYLNAIASVGGAPYVWTGKGEKVWHPVHGLISHPFGAQGFPLVFDCSGLVTWGLKQAGWKDWRATHSAQTLFTDCPPCDEPAPGDFLFYGSPGHADHIETLLPSGELYGALNGTPHSLTPDPSKARVRVRTKQRPDRIGWRTNPLRPAVTR